MFALKLQFFLKINDFFYRPKIMVYNGETCDEIFSLACQNQLPLRRMYDNHLALVSNLFLLLN